MDTERIGKYRSRLGTIGLSALNIFQYVLPDAHFQRLYRASFNGYRRIRRLAYRMRALLMTGPARDKNRWVHESMRYSLVGWRGLELTYDAVKQVHFKGIPGAIVECGVAEGGSALLMSRVTAAATDPRKVWLFDSYQGLPEPTSEDYKDGRTGQHVRPLPKGSCLGTLEQVSHLLFERYGLSRANVTLVKGWFDKTLPKTRDQIGPIALLRLDGDWYESTRCCIFNLYDLVSTGGYIIVDDYYSCYGCKKAIDEFIQQRRLRVQLQPDGRGGSYFIKP